MKASARTAVIAAETSATAVQRPEAADVFDASLSVQLLQDDLGTKHHVANNGGLKRNAQVL